MIKNPAEEVSMLMDDEVDEHSRVRIIQKLRDDANMKSCWERYHLISEALRNNLPEIIDPDLATRISSIINEDPHQDPRVPSIHHTPVTRRPNRMVTGFALAASLAAIAVVGLLQISNQNGISDQQLATAGQEISVTPEILPASVVQDNTVAQDNSIASLSMPASLSSQPVDLQVNQVGTTSQTVDADLYDYLIHHNEYAATMPVQGGMIPYARMVGYAADE